MAMLNAALLASRCPAVKSHRRMMMLPRQNASCRFLPPKATQPNKQRAARRYNSNRSGGRSSQQPAAATTVWPESFQAFIQGTPIVLRPLPYFGRVSIDFGTVMLNFGAISSLTGFVMTDVLYLRLLSITGSVSGIVYNITRVPKQLNAVAWGVVFVAVNLTRSIELLLDRQDIKFTVEEAEIYHRSFAHNGVEPGVFKKLLKHATWTSYTSGESIVACGKPLTRVHILVSGSAAAYSGGGEQGRTGQLLYSYSAKNNGCIIGATAVVDPTIVGRAYPNRIIAQDGPVRMLSFDTDTLREFFRDGKSGNVKGALLHMMYVDLIGSLRRNRKQGKGGTDIGLALHDLNLLLKQAACALPDNNNNNATILHPRQRRYIREHMKREHNISSDEQFKDLLQSENVGWSWSQWVQTERTANPGGAASDK